MLNFFFCYLRNLLFEAVLFARQINNLHETKNGCQKYFLGMSIQEKLQKVFFFPKSVNFLKSAPTLAISGQFSPQLAKNIYANFQSK